MNLIACTVTPPSNPSSSRGQSPARQQDMAYPAAIPDYAHDSGCRLAVRVQSRIQFVFSVFFSSVFMVFFGAASSSEILSK